ncbi:MAG: hypothetical protein V5A52_01795 [Halovenus sp.]|uniref:HVO_0234 family beta-propeller protein n=1 Tax=Halovenus amylolytica TaxID=2500550 RepID=UPI000FE38C42
MSGDNASEERQLFGDRREERTLFVASELGVTRIAVAAAQVGEFSLIERCPATDVAADAETLLVGTDESVLVDTGDGLDSLEFGPAVAVGIDDDWLYAASPNGTVARFDRDLLTEGNTPAESTAWETISEVTGPRRFDGDLLAAEGGVYRVGTSLELLGLDDVHDVSRAGPLAATASGLYYHEDGEWVSAHDGTATAVVSDADSAHAVIDGALFERVDGDWQELDGPTDSQPTLLAYVGTLSVIDAAGSISVAADPETSTDGHGGWRSQALGLRGPTGAASPDQ